MTFMYKEMYFKVLLGGLCLWFYVEISLPLYLVKHIIFIKYCLEGSWRGIIEACALSENQISLVFSTLFLDIIFFLALLQKKKRHEQDGKEQKGQEKRGIGKGGEEKTQEKQKRTVD